MDWLTAWEIPIGKTAKIVFDWLKTDFKAFFRAFGNGIEDTIEGFSDLLQAMPALVIVAALVGLTWAIQRSWQRCIRPSCSSSTQAPIDIDSPASISRVIGSVSRNSGSISWVSM